MDKVKRYIIAMMICFTGASVGSAIREYSRFKADKAIYDNINADWEGAVTKAMTNNLIWWAAVMLVLTVLLVGCIIYTKSKARKPEDK